MMCRMDYLYHFKWDTWHSENSANSRDLGLPSIVTQSFIFVLFTLLGWKGHYYSHAQHLPAQLTVHGAIDINLFKDTFHLKYV